MCQGRMRTGRSSGRWAAILWHRIMPFRYAVPRRHAPQVPVIYFGCRCVSLWCVMSVVVVVVPVVAPRFARAHRAEAIRHRRHKVVLVRIDLVVIVEDIRITGPPGRLFVVAVASLHSAEQSQEPLEGVISLGASLCRRESLSESAMDVKRIESDGRRVRVTSVAVG